MANTSLTLFSTIEEKLELLAGLNKRLGTYKPAVLLR
jgi:hypothetical protein